MVSVALLVGDYHVDRPRTPSSRMANGLGMAWARTPAPFDPGALILAPARFALFKEGAESFLRFAPNAKSRQPRGHSKGGLSAFCR
jgi:hypothetical protein